MALRAIQHSAARQLIVDITGVPVVDSQVAQGLLAVVEATRLLGAEAVLVGVRPEVAQTMVGLGLALPVLGILSLGERWPVQNEHMILSLTPLVLAYLISSVISALIAWHCWQRHEVNGAREYAVVALSQSLWTIGLIFELTSPELDRKIFWDNAQFVTTASWLLAFLTFTLRYTERRLPRPRITFALLAVPLVALIVLAYTDPLHGLIRAHIRLVPGPSYNVLLYDFTGPLWALAIYSYGAYLACVLMLLVNPARSNPMYRSQIAFLLIGTLVPIIGSVLTLSLLADAPDRDISPFTFAIGSILVAWALFRFRLFDLVPIARDVVVESLADAVFVIDPHWRLIDLNPAARRLLRAVDIDVGRLGTDALPDAWREPILRANAGPLYQTQELDLATPAGVRQVELRLQPVFSRRGTYCGLTAVVRDITERKAIEADLEMYRAQLEARVEARTTELRTTNELLHQEITHRQQLEAHVIQGQKLEALGRMASGIAHDFNNVLAVVRGAADLLIAQRAPDDPDMPDLAAIMQVTTQAGSLIRQLLAFSRGQSLQLAAVDLATVVGEFANILRRLAGTQIELRLDLHMGTTTVLADVSQLQQVLVNLVINARDAMPSGGS
ncbi:MAG TPA: histidine kinase N-terminal 7TM domain-containing protein [Roseiflexaceae bacterium]|nr:histidine kinase N-terminal 7TM domain-containing protein [Roseiflexaceae bacterium]